MRKRKPRPRGRPLKQTVLPFDEDRAVDPFVRIQPLVPRHFDDRFPYGKNRQRRDDDDGPRDE